MTGPSHHPTDEHLLAYAAGAMGEVKALLVATHLAFCPRCRRLTAGFEAVCGTWLDALADGPSAGGGVSGDGVAEDEVTRLLARLDAPATLPPAPPETAPPTRAAAPHDATVPEPLRSRLGGPVAAFDWTPIADGVDLSRWSIARDGTGVCLLRIAAGRPVPPHHHTAEEVLLVLEGAFGDEYGAFRVGDVAVYDPDTDHHAVAEAGATCLCLFLLDGPITFLNG